MNRLAEIRKEKNLTQTYVAKKLGISRQAYSNWETGNRDPDNETLIRIADYFNCSIDYILGRDMPIPVPLEPTPTPIQDAYDNAPPAIQEAVRKLLDVN